MFGELTPKLFSLQSLAARGVSGSRLTSTGYGTFSFKGGLTSVLAHKSTDQVITTSTWTKILLNTEDFDSGGMFDNATNYRFTPTIAGKYLIMVVSAIASLGDGKTFYTSIWFNGAQHSTGGSAAGGLTDGLGHMAQILTFNGSTDYVELYVWHNQGSNLSVYGTSTFLSGVLLEPA